MEINKDTLSKLKALDENELRAAIGDIADALGASPAQKRRALNNCKVIKNRIMNSDEADLKKIMGKIDPEKQEQLANKLKL